MQFASEELRANADVVLTAVCSHGCALEFAAKELRADRHIVIVAAETDGLSLQFASDELRTNREVVMVAASSAGEDALAFAASSLRRDKLFILAIGTVALDVDGLGWAAPELKRDAAFTEFVRCTAHIVTKRFASAVETLSAVHSLDSSILPKVTSLPPSECDRLGLAHYLKRSEAHQDEWDEVSQDLERT